MEQDKLKAKEAVEIIELLMWYGNIQPIDGVIYPEGSHREALERAKEYLNKYRKQDKLNFYTSNR